MTEQPPLPQVTHTYQNHHIDSTRWQVFKPRPDDIVVATTQKSGTTWTQQIVSLLIFQDEPPPAPFHDLSIFVDMRFTPLEELAQELESQSHRRFLKTHTALDGFPFHPEVKHIFVTRDGRDLFMSLWNHYSNYSDDILHLLDTLPGRVGDPFPPAGDDIHEFWHNWIGRGWFDWEGDGYPFWSQLHVIKTWWDYRHLPNILFVNYLDLLTDLKGQIKRIADYLEIDITPAYLDEITDLCTFESMKGRASEVIPMAEMLFKGGAQTFINKGTNGRWRDVLSSEELALYDKRAAEVLTPECRRWLESGGPVA
ncbi:MAG TPA: sulfotransferase [Porticoccaceae bacterium]|nr:sulfotransferase [Porticoccaceae bacterium]